MEAPRLEGAHFIGVFTSLVAFGSYTFVFAQTCYHMRYATLRSIVIPIKVTILWFLTLLSTVLQVSVVYDAFVRSRHETDVNLSFALWFERWQFTALVISTITTALIGNTLVCWQLCLVWKRSKKVLIAPFALLLGMAVCCSITIVYEIKRRTDDRYSTLKCAWQLASMVFTLAVNTIAMTMTGWQIWRASKSVSSLSSTAQSFYQNIIHVLIESGALYALVILASTILEGAKEIVGSVIVAYLLPQVIGFAPTLIALRIYTSVERSQGPDSDTFLATAYQRSSGIMAFPLDAETASIITAKSEVMFAERDVGDISKCASLDLEDLRTG